MVSIERVGNKWEASGFIDGEIMCVRVYAEDKRIIKVAGYIVDWGSPLSAFSEGIATVLVEHNGQRRIAEVRVRGTEDDWIKVNRKR